MTAKKIQEIVVDSLFRKNELVEGGNAPADAVRVDGVMAKFAFHKERLESHRVEVEEIVRQMPGQFLDGGWSFLNLCVDKNGQQWGEHKNVDELICLTIGLGIGKFLLPRDLWAALPGGMPYVKFDLKREGR